MRFEFATTARIVFGPGTAAELPALATALGTRALLITAGASDRIRSLRDALSRSGLEVTPFEVLAEPTTTIVGKGVEIAQASGANVVIAVGGGSVIDTGKAIAALAANGGEALDYLEVVGRGKSLSIPSLPLIAVPTTAGTGAEVTRNAVLASPEHAVKASLRSPTMLPRLALIDPELTLTLPPDVTASTGMDALTQLIEPFTCNRPNPMVDALCLEGIARAGAALRTAYSDGANLKAREEMCVASLFGGLALANAGLGAAHGFAGPIGGMFPAPHGAVCAALLPAVMRANVCALESRSPDSPALGRYRAVAEILTGDAGARAEDGARWVEQLRIDLRIPGLSAYGVTSADFPGLVAKAGAASSAKANPIALTPEEMAAILAESL